MTIVGFNITKIDVERADSIKGKININNNVSIKNIEATDLFMGKAKQKGLKFSFEFKTIYEPKLAHILLGGNVVVLKEEKEVKSIVDDWKNKKKMPKDIMAHILNTILTRCNIEALLLSREVGLPAPIRLPKVEVKKTE